MKVLQVLLAWVILTTIGVFLVGWLLKKEQTCPKCGCELDYEYIGYKGIYGYCHNCKYRGDR